MIQTPLSHLAEQLHTGLLEELKTIRAKKDEPTKLEEACLKAGSDFRKKLYETVMQSGFADTREEIHFFKVLKPVLVAEMEYCHRIYHGMMFSPKDQQQSKTFFQREISRMDSLLQNNQDFVAYYLSGANHFDHFYFRGGNASWPSTLYLLPGEYDPRITCSHGDWVSGLLAVKRYKEYAQYRAENIPG